MNKITEKDKNVFLENLQGTSKWVQKKSRMFAVASVCAKKSPLSACSDRNKNLVN